MTLTEMAMTGLVLVVILLTVIVARLSGQLTRLSRQVGDLRSGPPPAPPSLPVPSVDPVPTADMPTAEPPADQPALHQGEHDADVSVITHLDDDPDRDLTTARLASVTLGGPLIKVAALSHGVRRALREEHRMRILYVVRKEMRRQRKIRRRGRAERAPSQGWRP